MVDEQKIRELLQAGKTYFAITAETGVSSATIAKIAKAMKNLSPSLDHDIRPEPAEEMINLPFLKENEADRIDEAVYAAREFIRLVKQNRRRPSLQNEMRVKNAVYGLKVRVINL